MLGRWRLGDRLSIRSLAEQLGLSPTPVRDAINELVVQGVLEQRSGDLVEVRIKITADRPYQYLMLEDPLPAGCEVPDQGRVPIWEWDDWWADRIVRDELVAFALTELPAGSKEVSYKLVAQIPGSYSAMPTQIYNMYDPRVRTAGAIASFVIKP